MDSKSINGGIARIKSIEKKHLDLGIKMLSAYGGTFYLFDMLALAALNRSLSLCSGFRKMIYLRNFICAAPLVRMQLDSALRIYAAFIVDDPHLFAKNVFNGISVRDQKDKNGRKLTDANLVEDLSKDYKWIKNVYKQTSGYVHLSEKHIANTHKSFDNKTRSIEHIVATNQRFLPKEIFLEAINGFVACTEILFKFLEGWVFTKDNPELVEEIVKRRKLKKPV